MEKLKKAATALIFNPNRDGTICMVSRKNDFTNFGLIGGKCEPGETREQSVKRETEEETGLKIIDCVPIFRRKDGEYNSVTFLCIVENEDFKTTEKGIVKWGEWEEIESGSFGKYNKLLHSHVEKLRSLMYTIIVH